MTLSGLQKKIADKFLQETIKHHIKKEYLEKGITPTVEQVLQDIPAKKMLIILQNGYTREEITKIAEDIIGKQKR